MPFEAALTDKPGPMTMTPIVCQLTESDAKAFQTLRLEGLENHPCEFGTAVEEEAELTLVEIEQRLAQGRIYGAFLDGELAAIAGFRMQDRIKKRHKGELFGVYVQKDARGQKLGEAVVRQVIHVAGREVEQLLATVASLNHPAKALYAKLGFETYGHEPRGLKVGDRYYDQEHLVLMLDQSR
ncbi:MAG: GNAT family N-acetyltransferase [Geminicoccaceae bacterium]